MGKAEDEIAAEEGMDGIADELAITEDSAASDQRCTGWRY